MTGKQLFVVTGAGRDGAAMLGAALSRDPNVRWLGNFMRVSTSDRADTLSVGRLLDHLADQYDQPLIGFRLLADEARTGRWAVLRSELQKRGVLVIGMRRRDTLRQLCSWKMQRQRVPQGQVDTTYLSFDDQHSLWKMLGRFERLYRMDDRDWADARRVLLDYESIAARPDLSAPAWILLGLTPPKKLLWTTRRWDERRTSHIIKNYEQVRLWLRGTRWAHLVRRA